MVGRALQDDRQSARTQIRGAVSVVRERAVKVQPGIWSQPAKAIGGGRGAGGEGVVIACRDTQLLHSIDLHQY